MKKIDIIPIFGEEKKPDNTITTTNDLIRGALNNRPKDGFSLDEMRSRIRILDLLSDDDTLELEDADAKVLQRCVKEMKWGVMHQDIVNFCDVIGNL